LRAQNFLAHAVDRHPLERFGHRGQRAHHVELAGAAHLIQREALSLPLDQEISAFGLAIS
jgi:hypothetical protein